MSVQARSKIQFLVMVDFSRRRGNDFHEQRKCKSHNEICAGHDQREYWKASAASHADPSNQPDCSSRGKAVYFIFSHRDQIPASNRCRASEGKQPIPALKQNPRKSPRLTDSCAGPKIPVFTRLRISSTAKKHQASMAIICAGQQGMVAGSLSPHIPK